MSAADQSASQSKAVFRPMLTARLSPQFVKELLVHVETFAKRGVEVSGLLFGRSEEELIDIEIFRPFPELGSNPDPVRQARQLDEHFYTLMMTSRTDPELPGLELIGWYSLRSTGGMREGDIHFHNRHFRRPMDVVLIVRPEGEQNLLELYTRTAAGSLAEGEHRSGVAQLSKATPATDAVDIAIRAKINDDFYLRAYEVGNSLERAERREQWKRTAEAGKRMALSVLRPKRNQPQADKTSESLRPASLSADRAEPSVSQSELAERVEERLPADSPIIALHRIRADEPNGKSGITSRQKEHRLPWLPLTIVFIVVAAATFGLVLLYELPAGTLFAQLFRASLPGSGLQLRAEGHGDRLLLSWNRLNPTVRSAKEGVLQITDGSQYREVKLDAGQVANGSVLYRPASGDVTFRLEVRGSRGEMAQESTRVLDAQQPQGSEQAAQKQVNEGSKTIIAGTGTKDTAVSRATPTLPAALPLPESSGASTPTSTASAIKRGPDSSAGQANDVTIQTAAAPLAPAKGTSTLLSPPALRDLAAPAEPDPKLLSLGEPPLPKPAQSDEALGSHAAKAANTPDLNRPYTKQPELKQPDPAGATLTLPQLRSANGSGATAFVPPAPIRQVLPNAKAFSPAAIDSTEEIEVEVAVDKTGHVENARITRDTGKANSVLARAAITAAKQWTFRPATLHGVAVASDHRIVFQFHPAAR